MGLQLIAVTDLFSFQESVQSAQGGEFAIYSPGTATTAGMSVSIYLDGLDKIIQPVRLTGGFNNRMGFNPLLAGFGFPDTFIEATADFTVRVPLIPGDPLFPGGQKLYASESGTVASSEWEEVSPITSLLNSGSGAFPTTPPGNGPIRVTLGIGTATPTSAPGGWNAGSSTFGFGFPMVVFEGLTDGIVGETNLTGSNVYPAGLGLIRVRGGTCPAPIGTGGANDCDNALAWLDLNTGLLDGRMINTPGLVAGSGPNTEAPIAGQSFFWQVKQYIPDVDATFATPKGELMLVSDDNAIPADPANFSQSVFVKMIDYNPFNVAPAPQAPSRLHERVRLLSTVDFNDTPNMFDIAGASAAQNTNFGLHYHPPTRRFFMILGVLSPTIPNVTGESAISYWARQVAPSVVSSPVARDVPRTNDITEFEVFVTGSIAEPVAGVQVEWSLFRNSTKGEILNASVFPGTSTVANPPIDQSFPIANEGTLVVEADSVLLVEGVDYTVVLSTGVITWITDQSGATVVTADYEHREANASPPNGTLLVSLSQSQEDGRAFSQILYADDNDLVGSLDRLIADLA